MQAPAEQGPTAEILGGGNGVLVRAVLAAVLGFAVTGAAMWAQQIQLGGGAAQALSMGPANSTTQASAAKKGHVSLISDAAEIDAGKPQVLELVFRVDPGFHINSHTPKDELLIPTVLRVTPQATKVLSESYPAGTAFQLSLPGAVGKGETLDVYQGEFRVALRVIAPRGASTLTGSLHYQACDNAACFPPRTLPVMVALTGR
jgi:hypothetical protein